LPALGVMFVVREQSVGWPTYPNSAGQIPFVIYYSRVALELSKMVFRGQNMSPP